MEPERHIEKLLRAVAKKRREQTGEPFELHSVAREQLLREAAQRGAKKSGGGFFAPFFSGFGPRLTLAFTVVVIVVVGVWLVRPLLQEKQAASTLGASTLHADRAVHEKVKSEPAAPPPETAAPVVNSETLSAAGAQTTSSAAVAGPISGETAAKDDTKKQPAPTPAFKSQSSQAQANRNLALAAEAPKAAGAPQPGIALPSAAESTAMAPPPASTQAVREEKTRATDSFAAAKSGSPARPFTTNGIAPSMTVAAANREAQKQLNQATAPGSVNADLTANFDNIASNQTAAKSAPNSQRFYRTITVPTVRQRGFGGGSPAPALLASFQMEQHGQEIRVIDADGSVYTGTWQAAPEQNALPAAAPAPAHEGGFHLFNSGISASSARVAVPENNFQTTLNYTFTVTGTNRNLKQKITFSGKFIPLTNASNAANTAGAVSGSLEGPAAAPPLNMAPPALLNSRIAGKAVVGEKREIEVNANPAP